MLVIRSAVLGLVLMQLPVGSAAQTITISEFLARNDTVEADGDGDYADWIELHNAGQNPVDLSGWYLTDDPDRPQRWPLPAVELSGGGYLLIWASGKDRRDPAGELHTNFKLSGSGEYLAIVETDGATPADEFAPEFPPQQPDVSYGRVGNHSESRYLPTPTPGTANDPTDSWTSAGDD